MKCLNFLKSIIIICCCVLSVSISGFKKAKSGNRPNIILVLADYQGWGDVGYNGHPVVKTPNLDDMAGSGLRFDRFYSAAPVCSPTRASIMTGRHPNRFGCFTWGHTLRPQEYTIAEALKDAGYVTDHFGKWHLGPVYKDSPVNPGASGFDEWFSSPNYFDNDPILSRKGIAVQTQGESSMVTVDAALEFIRENRSRPFFAYICFGSPHGKHIAIEQYKELYPDQIEKLQNFFGEITGIDMAVGKLRRELKNIGIEKNTVLWYLSDNGGLKWGIQGGREMKGSIYEGGLRVPSIVEWPGQIKNPGITNIPCNTSDIYPTFIDIAEINSENKHVLDGISLEPLFKNEMKSRENPIGFWKYPKRGNKVASYQLMLELLQKQQAGDMKVDSSKLELYAGEITKQYPADILPGHAAWLDWPYKLHRIRSGNNKIKYELYNIEVDPYEKNNIAGRVQNQVESMSCQLEEWMRSVINSLNGDDYLNTEK